MACLINVEALLVCSFSQAIFAKSDAVIEQDVFVVTKDSEWNIVVPFNASWYWDLTVLLQLSMCEDNLSLLIDDIALCIDQITKIINFTSLSIEERVVADATHKILRQSQCVSFNISKDVIFIELFILNELSTF